MVEDYDSILKNVISFDTKEKNRLDYIEYDTLDIDSIARSHGIYTKSDIARLKKDRFNVRSAAIDPYSYVIRSHEILFFTKFDLSIVKTYKDATALEINPDLANDAYFARLIEMYPNVVRGLQASAPSEGMGVDSTGGYPFINLLTYYCKGGLSLPSVSAESISTPTNAYGTNYTYRGSGEGADDSISFSLEFNDGPDLELYQFLKAYDRYEQFKSHGLVSPAPKYIENRVLHDQGGVFKFTLADDMSTILHYAYMWGVYPNNVPREAFDQPIDGGLSYSVDFKAAFVDDMDPVILSDFNFFTQDLWNKCESSGLEIKYGYEYYKNAAGVRQDYISGELMVCPHVIKDQNKKFHLVWR